MIVYAAAANYYEWKKSNSFNQQIFEYSHRVATATNPNAQRFIWYQIPTETRAAPFIHTLTKQTNIPVRKHRSTWVLPLYLLIL